MEGSNWIKNMTKFWIISNQSIKQKSIHFEGAGKSWYRYVIVIFSQITRTELKFQGKFTLSNRNRYNLRTQFFQDFDTNVWLLPPALNAYLSSNTSANSLSVILAYWPRTNIRVIRGKLRHKIFLSICNYDIFKNHSDVIPEREKSFHLHLPQQKLFGTEMPYNDYGNF